MWLFTRESPFIYGFMVRACSGTGLRRKRINQRETPMGLGSKPWDGRRVRERRPQPRSLLPIDILSRLLKFAAEPNLSRCGGKLRKVSETIAM